MTLRERLLKTQNWEEYAKQRNHYVKKLLMRYSLNDIDDVCHYQL